MIILITGSSLGIGAATARKFAEEKNKVIITYNKDSAEQIENECKEHGAKDTCAIKLDVTNDKSIKEAVGQVKEKYGRIDWLINNAGIVRWKDFAEHTSDDIESQISVNLLGLIKMTKECLPIINKGIINISSGAGIEAYSGLSVYCASKFGVRGFTHAIAQELPLKVFCVNPGMTATRMTGYKGVPPEKVAQVIFDTVKGRNEGVDVDM